MLSCSIEVGGSLPVSAKNAVHMIPFGFVAKMRADPFDAIPIPTLLSTDSPTAGSPKRRVPLAGTLREVALGSLNAAPPPDANPSTPTRIAASVVFVHRKKGRLPPVIANGTE
jgi:hypothetical protein